MTTPTDIADLIRRSVAPEAVDERPDLLMFRAPLADDALRAAWLLLRAKPPDFVRMVGIVDAESDAPLDEDAHPAPNDRFQISVTKMSVQGELRLFLGRSLSSAIDALAGVDCVRVADMGSRETFTTFRDRFQLWSLDAALPYGASESLPDPRAFTKDFTGAAAVPPDLRPWLLRSPPEAVGDVFRIWRAAASRRLLACVADQVSAGGTGAVTYHFTGPPARTFSIDDQTVTNLFDRLTASATWTFTEARDNDTRHLLLANEWARTYRAGAQGELGDGSLESARGAYAAYVKSGSRETLKALADLRKAVVEESQKASQRAQDLAGAIWKDLAVTAAPFVLKVLPDSAKISNQVTAGGMAVVAAVFLVYSFSIQVYINHRYFRHQRDARVIWRQALNAVLSQAEIEQFSEQPIIQSIQDYRRVRLSVGIVYGVLVAILAGFAIFNFSLPPAPPAPAHLPPQCNCQPAGTQQPVAPTPTQPPPAQTTAPPAAPNQPNTPPPKP